MSSQLWTIIAVVVGAAVGGGAQLLNDWLRRRDERRATLRDDRQEAYIEFLAASSGALAPLAGASHPIKHRPGISDLPRSEVEHEGQSSLATEGQLAMNRLTLASARVELVGPRDTSTSAGSVTARVMEYLFQDENGTAEALSNAQAEFLWLAKRDLKP